MDLDTGKTIPISELEISEFLITFITDQLVHNRYYRITVHAINRAGPVSNSITTSESARVIPKIKIFYSRPL